MGTFLSEATDRAHCRVQNHAAPVTLGKYASLIRTEASRPAVAICQLTCTPLSRHRRGLWPVEKTALCPS